MPESEHRKTPSLELFHKFLESEVAVKTGLTIVYPLERARLQIATEQDGLASKSPTTSLFRTIRKIYRCSGLTGVYKGSFWSIMFGSPDKTIKLISHDLFRNHAFAHLEGNWPRVREFLAGGCSGSCQSLITTPIDTVKIQVRENLRVSPEKPIQVISIAAQLLKSKGMRGMYEGLVPAITRDVTFATVHFPVFIFLMNSRCREGETELGYISSLFIDGFIAGVVGALAATPFDVIRYRMQEHKKHREWQYHGVLHAATKILKCEGPKALFKTSGIRMCTIGPLFGTAQALYNLPMWNRIWD